MINSALVHTRADRIVAVCKLILIVALYIYICFSVAIRLIIRDGRKKAAIIFAVYNKQDNYLALNLAPPAVKVCLRQSI